MRKQIFVLAVGAVLTVLLAGCSADSSPGAGASPGSGTVDEAANAAAKAQKEKTVPGTSRPPANTRGEVFPWVERAYAKVTWPPSYKLTADAIYTRFMAPATEVKFVEQDAVDMVNIWNVCAWTLQLIDDTKGGKSADQDLTNLTNLATGDIKPVLEAMVKEAKLGGITSATQFATANDCKKGFKA